MSGRFRRLVQGVATAVCVASLAISMSASGQHNDKNSDKDKDRDKDKHGQVGPPGPTGPAGPAGPPGPAGPAGPAGAIGPSGPAGASALVGEIASGGACGLGRAGASITDGAGNTVVVCDGEKGATGEVGPPGADGLAGPDGLDGYVHLQSNATIVGPGMSRSVDVFCSPGKRVLSGGFEVSNGIPDSRVVSSRPASSSAWMVVVRNEGVSTNVVFRVWAICA
jgi:hypothetical protein